MHFQVLLAQVTKCDRIREKIHRLPNPSQIPHKCRGLTQPAGKKTVKPSGNARQMTAPGIPALPCQAPVGVATHLQGSLQEADFLKEDEEEYGQTCF